VLNAVMRIIRQRTRVFIHKTADVEALVEAAGLTRRFFRQGLYWQVAVFERA
jgi:hypothetical protein